MEEVWKDVQGYEGYYQVSNHGRVKSLDRKVKNRGGIATKKGKILSPSVMNNQYKKIALWKDNEQKMMLMHRLIAQAFIPNTGNLPEVNHIDEDKGNNSVDNLEWCDRLYNANYGTAIERSASKRKGVSVGERAIEQYTTNGVFVRSYDSAMKAAEAIKGCNSGICKCANGRYKIAHGYVWRWKTEQNKKVI